MPLSTADLLGSLLVSKMGEVISAAVKELSCHDCVRFVCNVASVHSRCCDSEECCQGGGETRPAKPLEEEVEIEVKVDSPGCVDVHGLCCLMHASRRYNLIAP